MKKKATDTHYCPLDYTQPAFQSIYDQNIDAKVSMEQAKSAHIDLENQICCSSILANYCISLHMKPLITRKPHLLVCCSMKKPNLRS